MHRGLCTFRLADRPSGGTAGGRGALPPERCTIEFGNGASQPFDRLLPNPVSIAPAGTLGLASHPRREKTHEQNGKAPRERMIKLSDYVVEYLVDHGVNEIFLVSGGGIMHLVDSVGRNPRMRYVCNYHEQACAIAAEACARVKNRVAACLVTTGPGATNALSGIAGAWFDSIPVLVLSGQVRTPLIADYNRLRQLGPQEVNVLPMARPVTKYCVSVRDPRTIREELDRAFSAATSGRPGPVWLELPLDIQSATIDEARPGPSGTERPAPGNSEHVRQQARAVVAMLQTAKRPVLIFGNGRSARAGRRRASPISGRCPSSNSPDHRRDGSRRGGPSLSHGRLRPGRAEGGQLRAAELGSGSFHRREPLDRLDRIQRGRFRARGRGRSS